MLMKNHLRFVLWLVSEHILKGVMINISYDIIMFCSKNEHLTFIITTTKNWDDVFQKHLQLGPHMLV